MTIEEKLAAGQVPGEASWLHPAPEKMIPLAEIFGPTIQGEGALAGRPTYFVRIGGCDYKCEWCDTGFAVNPDEVRKLERVSDAEIAEKAVDLARAKGAGETWLTISGGNPAMYDLTVLVRAWGSEVGLVAVETQGSRYQPWLELVDMLTISPKPPSSGLPAEQSLLNLKRFMDQLQTYHLLESRALKCIVFDESDYEFASLVHKTYPQLNFYLSCGTAMGGLSGRWVPPAIPGLDERPGPIQQPPKAAHEDYDYFWRQRGMDEAFVPLLLAEESKAYVEPTWHLLRRARWLTERAAADPDMADAAIFPQLHALLWGLSTRGV